jgi:peptidoglycan hydrolase-like protein with peptidoglycan-binding domain
MFKKIIRLASFGLIGASLLLGSQVSAQQASTTVTGIAPAQPLSIFCYTFNQNLNLGSRGADVTALDQILRIEGIKASIGDDYYGITTLNAVKKLQVKYGITPANGNLGPKTRAVLNAKFGCKETGGVKNIIRVVSPNGKEVFKKNTSRKIEWFSATTTGTVNIDIETPGSVCPPNMYCLLANPVAYRIAIGLPATQKEFAWAVGSTTDGSAIPDGNYRLLVTHSSGLSDLSDEPFSLTSSGSFCYDFKASMQRGSSGSEALALDTALLLEGFTINPDTSYGVTTETAVKQFQTKYGITPVSGKVGALTRAKLNELYACNKPIKITSLSPVQGPIGTIVEITGSGFASTSNFVHFGGGIITNVPSTNNGTKISFTVPQGLPHPACATSNVCPMSLFLVTPGMNYPVKVSRPAGNGTSNAVQFRVTSSTTPPTDNNQAYVTVKTNKSAYVQGETVNITINAVNPLNEPKTIQLMNGCRSNYVIGPYNNARNTLCTQAITSYTIPAKSTTTYTHAHQLTLPPTGDIQSISYIPAGTHTVVGLVHGVGEGKTVITVAPSTATTTSVTSLSRELVMEWIQKAQAANATEAVKGFVNILQSLVGR